MEGVEGDMVGIVDMVECLQVRVVILGVYWEYIWESISVYI